MSMNTSARAESISVEQMRDAVERSGYLLERRVANRLIKEGYKSEANRGFYDWETGKSCEYDIYAHKDIMVYGIRSCGIFPTLMSECKNNPQPYVFFVKEGQTSEPLSGAVMVSGIPAKIWRRGECVSIQKVAKVESFHHYCKPEVPVATQCCTFEIKKTKPSWVANYSLELYEPIRKLLKALEHEINVDFKVMSKWFGPGERRDFMDLSFYYPVLICQGDIYAVYVDNLTFKKCNHVQFNPEFFSFYHNEIIDYHMDVITEEYLPSYLKIMDQEMLEVKKQLEKQKNEVILSVGRIVEECRSLKNKPPTYRKYLEFDFYR